MSIENGFAAAAFGNTLTDLGEGAAALASTVKKNINKLPTGGYTMRFARNAAADGLAYIPILGTFGSWVLRHKDTARVAELSPTKMHAKLDEYGESYNLTKFQALSETAIEGIHSSASHIIGSKGTVDISALESISKTFDKNNDPAAVNARQDAIKAVNTTLSDGIPKTKLGAIQDKFNDIKRAIEKGENPSDPKLAADTKLDPIYTPYAAAEAFNNIYAVAQEELKEERKTALEKLEALFKEATPISDFQKNFALLFNAKARTDDEIRATIKEHKKSIIDEVSASYTKAENELKEQLEGKPASKDANGKDVEAVDGMKEKVRIASNASKADLISRINVFEGLCKLDPKVTLPNQELTGTVSSNDITMDPAAKRRCLKNLSRKQLNEIEIAGWAWGKRTRGDKTSDGTKLMIQNENGEFRAGLKVPGLWFPYHKATPQQLFKDMLEVTDLVLAQGEVPPKIKWDIDATTDELRDKMIVAACLAAYARGVDPKHVTINASGSPEEKKNFTKKNAADPEVMQILRASGDEEVKKMLDAWQKEEKAIEGKNNKVQTQASIKMSIQSLVEKQTVESAKDLNPDEDNSLAHNPPRM